MGIIYVVLSDVLNDNIIQSMKSRVLEQSENNKEITFKSGNTIFTTKSFNQSPASAQ